MALTLLLALAATSTTGLSIGDAIPTWRQPVASAEGRHVDLRDYYGAGPLRDRRVLVTFGASWCAPCKQEIEELVAAQEALAKAKVDVVVIVSDDDAPGRAKMVEWLARRDVPFSVVVDELGILRRRYRADALPAAFVADERGRLILVRSGYERGLVEALLRGR